MIVYIKLNVNDSYTVYELKRLWVDASDIKQAIKCINDQYGEEMVEIVHVEY